MNWLPVLSLGCGLAPPAAVGALGAPATDPSEPLVVRTFTVDGALQELLQPDLRPSFRQASWAELEALRTAVLAVSRGTRRGTIPPDATTSAAAAGMRIEQWVVSGRAHLALVELPDQRRGMGAYLFATERGAATSEVLLQAPHPYHDQRTGEIAAEWYFEHRSSFAFFTSTLHRYTREDGTRKKTASVLADPCHTANHPFNVATQAVARSRAATTVVQLHGFASDLEGDDRPPPGTLMVVSGGKPDRPTDLALAVDRELGAVLGPDVRLFPTEVTALGGTTNVQARGLAPVPGARFLHVEISDAIRPRLASDEMFSASIAETVFDSIRSNR